MPTYDYICDSCEYSFEIKQGFHDSPLKKCPECKKKKLRRILYSPHVNVIHEPNTIGQLASRNTSKMGHYEREHKLYEIPEEKQKVLGETQLPGTRITGSQQTPWWREGKKLDKTLSKLTPEQQHRYIETGKK